MIGSKTISKTGQFLQKELRSELSEQGHTLIGALERSINYEISSGEGIVLEVLAEDYSRYVNDGFPAKSASWKQFPFLIEYFRKRGLSEDEAKGAAAGTIQKWMKEGMPTESSKAYSSNNRRTEAMETVFNDKRTDRQIEAGISGELDDLLEMGVDVVI